MRGFRVRLACVRHAASVDSEPGSNSQVKVVDPAPPPEGKAAEYNSFNARSLLMIGSLYVVQFVKYGWFTARSGPELTARQRLALRHPLILDGLCLHVLSSFQRTGSAVPLLTSPSLGEPSNLTSAPEACQAPDFSFSFAVPSFRFRKRREWSSREVRCKVRRTAPNLQSLRSVESGCQATPVGQPHFTGRASPPGRSPS